MKQKIGNFDFSMNVLEEGEDDPRPFNLRPADEVTKRDLRRALTFMPSDPHPFCPTSIFLNLYILIIDECSINLIL